MKVVVTGFAGFFGSNFTEYLLSKNYEVVGIDNFNDFYNPKIKEYNIREFKDHKNLKIYREDILDTAKLEEIFQKEKPDTVVHLAAWAGVTNSIADPITYIKNNIEGTVNMAEVSVKHKIKSFVFASTSSVYGTNPPPFNEEMPIVDPLSPYPATKYAGEMLLRTYSLNFNLPVTVFRIFNPVGKRLRPDLVIPKMIRSCEYGNEFPMFQDSDSTGRDYCYVLHMFEMIEKVLYEPFKFEVFNLGNANPVTLGEIMSATEKVTGKKINVKVAEKRQGEMQITHANIEKAKKMLGYNPTTPIEESIKIYYEWYLKQDENYKKGEF